MLPAVTSTPQVLLLWRWLVGICLWFLLFFCLWHKVAAAAVAAAGAKKVVTERGGRLPAAAAARLPRLRPCF